MPHFGTLARHSRATSPHIPAIFRQFILQLNATLSTPLRIPSSCQRSQPKTVVMPRGNRYKSSRITTGKQPLKRCTIAITGDFGEQRSTEQIRKWISVNGGVVAHEITPKVTHLVCSKEHFKKNVAMGMAPSHSPEIRIVGRLIPSSAFI